jgi:hypothetical protein
MRQLTVILFFAVALASAQDSTDPSSKSTSNQRDPSGNTNSSRTSSSHDVFSNRTVDKQSTQHVGLDGRYVPYSDTERESIIVDATTTRTVERSYGRGPDGQRVLIQVRESETRALPNGGQNVTRSTSNPDANGRLQLVQREVQQTRSTGRDSTETKSTVYLPDVNGSMSAAVQSQERSTKNGDTTQYRKTTQLPDGNGRWQLSEVRQGTIKAEGKEQSREETVSRPDGNGALSVVEKTVHHEAATSPGENKQTEETYSTAVPGSSPDGSLHLTQKVTTVQRAQPGGGSSTEQRVQQPNPGNPTDGLQTTGATIDIVRPGANGTSVEKTTTLAPGSNGSLGVVWVDTKKTDAKPAIQVDTKAPADNKSPAKPQ